VPTALFRIAASVHPRWQGAKGSQTPPDRRSSRRFGEVVPDDTRREAAAMFEVLVFGVAVVAILLVSALIEVRFDLRLRTDRIDRPS
jgi:hypothetical protein